MTNKQQNKPRLVYVAEGLSMSLISYKLVKAIFEDDEEGIENVHNRRIETTLIRQWLKGLMWVNRPSYLIAT